MAVFGIGIDLVRLERIKALVERWGGKFEVRVFTEAEIAFCSKRKNRSGCLAMRFAAKEAFVKALGLGLRAPVLWHDMEIRANKLGKPEIFLSERATQYCTDLGIRSWQLSLTDDGDYGAAVVVIET